jgi:hypothetical protein
MTPHQYFRASHAFRASYVTGPIYSVMAVLALIATLHFQSVNHATDVTAGSNNPIAGTGS